MYGEHFTRLIIGYAMTTVCEIFVTVSLSAVGSSTSFLSVTFPQTDQTPFDPCKHGGNQENIFL